MQNRRNKNLHIVRDQEDPTDKVIADIMTELNSEDRTDEDMVQAVREHKKKVRRKTVTAILSVAAVSAAVFLFVYLQTYTKVRVADTYAVRGANDSSYEEFANGVLKYSRDGVAYLNQKGEEQWNQPCQVKNPFVDVNGTSAQWLIKAAMIL